MRHLINNIGASFVQTEKFPNEQFYVYLFAGNRQILQVPVVETMNMITPFSALWAKT